MPPSPVRRNPRSRRPARRGREGAEPSAGSPEGGPQDGPGPRVIARWRAELLADTAFLGYARADPAAARRRVHAWWAGLDLATATDAEVAEVWAWRRREAADPAPTAWEVLLALYDGDRERLKRDLDDELAERAARGALTG